MDRIGLEYDFDNLSPGMFREFLRELQTTPYGWPNLYFAWEKDDGSLLMLGTNSSQMWQMIVRECIPESFQNRSRADWGLAPEYSAYLYGISPNVSYCESGGKRYDPVEKLVAKVSDYKYLGHWRDYDVLMDDPHGYNRVLACGRFELALEGIYGARQYPIDAVLSDAKERAGMTNDGVFESRTIHSRGSELGSQEGVSK